MDWFNTYSQLVKIKQCVILIGNVRDEFYLSESKQYVLLPDFLVQEGENMKFELSIKWNMINGLNFANVNDVQRFDQLLNQAEPIDDGEEEYDTGDDTPLREISLTRKMKFHDFISAISTITENHSVAIHGIVDWGDYIMNQQLQPDDYENLVTLGMYSVNTGLKEKIRSSRLQQTTTAITIITSNISYIHHSFYEPDPRIKIITVTKPDMKERANYINRHFDDFNLDMGKEANKRKTQEIIDDFSSLTDQLTNADLRMIMEMANKYEKNISPEKLINYYKFGERTSPWELLNESKLNTLENELKNRVIGQDEPIQHVVNTIIKASLGLSGLQHSATRTKPKGTLFFVGPTGVGKTELAKGIAKFLFGDESAFIRFDMSEFKQEHSDQKLIGAPPGYVGFEAGGQLTNAVMERPFSVLLFDEIEKAHEKILDTFLGILEDGRLTDGRGETAYFSETIIIFTSNLGAKGEAKGGINDRRQQYQGAIEEYFIDQLGRPEILNRIGENIVIFNSITDISFMKKILMIKLKPLKNYIIEKFGIGLEITNEVYDKIIKDADPKYGGRGIINLAESALINPLSIYIFKNKTLFVPGRYIEVSWEDGKINFDLEE